MLHTLKPGTFASITRKSFPVLAVLTTITFIIGLYFSLFDSPPDYQQGETVRIMYLHVPAASMALGIYALIAVASLSYLIWRNPVSDMIAQASAPIGATYAAITLITGSLWGKPIWNTWWVWDARLTFMLILFFFYIGHMAISRAFDSPERCAKIAAIIGLIGAVNLPIIKFSVEWWNTLHQPASLLRIDGPSIDISMLLPLLIMMAGFGLLYLTLLCAKVQSLTLERKIARRQLSIAASSR